MFKTVESKLRTVSKTVVYRILCTIGVGLLSLALGADGATAGLMALVSFVLGTIMYYVHDRVWNKISWRRDAEGKESPLRSLIKTIIYRILVVIVIMLTARLILTEDNNIAVAFAIGQFVINMILYYVVERVANLVQKGRIKMDNDIVTNTV
jgi:uncharacterized membrane protein